MAVNLRLRTLGPAWMLLAALAIAGCAAGGGKADAGASTGPASTPPVAPSGTGAAGLTVTVASTPSGAKYLVDGSGRAVYLFQNDLRGLSSCDGACAQTWRPVPGAATAGLGLTAPLTTVTRADGTTQAVYAGHPLYYFQGDSGPGQTNGHDLNRDGGRWLLVDPDGKALPTG